MPLVFAPGQPGNLRIRPDRIGLYGTALAAIGAAIVLCQWIATHASADWGVFRSAAHLAGTHALLAPGQMNPFVYLPAFAWAYVPFAPLAEVLGAMVNAVIMLGLAAISAMLAARIYRVPVALSFLLVFAWAPVWSVLVLGQNAAMGLLLVMTAILGAVENSPWIDGLAIGGLLYKPQYALPFVLFACIVRRWQTLGVCAGCAAVWYFASAGASGGDWEWPARWLHVVSEYASLDAAHNAPFAIGLPTLLFRFGIHENIAIILGIVLLIFGIWKIFRRPLLEAWSLLPLIGLATSAHALEYDAVLALPAIFWTITHVREPVRTWIIATAYLLAPFWLLSSIFRFDSLTVIVLGGVLLYVLDRYGTAIEGACRP